MAGEINEITYKYKIRVNRPLLIRLNCQLLAVLFDFSRAWCQFYAIFW